ncbi:LysE family translocator [Jiella endophytica]|uniref:LysE family translocator n=1 Tax=Jiella endophytica TaxID=2558362 RepID=A0A4Y8R9W4_9HYPH|nr:LysE family translocator [Jiella endophytica]TFF18397.1 LysE family translocator [Jiella endophytica]
MTTASIAPFAAYAAALGIAAFIPGPGVAGLVGQSLGSGLRAALFFLAGLALGDLAYLTIAVAGLAALAEIFAEAFLVVKILGGAYLIYLATVFWRNRGGLAELHAAKARSGARSLLAGFMVTLGNPKTIVFYLALLPSVLDLRGVGVSQYVVLSILTILVLFLVLSPYAFVAAKARGMMTRPQAIRRLNRAAGGVIGGAGALILGEAAVAALRRV